MTQVYYTERLLPVYVREIHDCRIMDDRYCILQEDNDPSHGTRSEINVARTFKAVNWLSTLTHPPQSPDLNPAEGCWNILKQRVRRRRYKDLVELKAIILEEWEQISMNEFKDRIREMPDRCKKLMETGGEPIKSSLW